MFSTLESTWDRPARRGWSTLASFTFQALALSLLFALPLIWVQAPPLLRFSDILTPPPAVAPRVPRTERRLERSSNISAGRVVQPWVIPDRIAKLIEAPIPAAPDLSNAVPGGISTLGRGVQNAVGDPLNAVMPPPPHAPAHPIRISYMAEGSLIYRVQPEYPQIAREARIQGAVQLRAIISKAGTIENLTVESGPPMLISSALKAVRQWRYRPYLLNGEAVEVDTEITVNFILAE